MSNVDTPPKPYFSGINFNPSFFSPVIEYLTEAIANSKYLRLIGGILSGNLGIKRTPAVELDVNGKVFINNNIFTLPSNGVYGGDGTRLILAPGNASATPYSLGIATSTLWYGVPNGANHIFYTGTDERLRIKSDGNVGIGHTNPGNILQVGDGGRLRIANDETDFTLIGTRNINSLQNTQIAISGRTRTTFAGNIDLITTSTGKHIFSNEGNVRMLITNDGNVGIGTNDPGNYKCYIKGKTDATSTFIKIETPLDLIDQISGIHLGIPAYNEATCAKILSKTFLNLTNNLEFHTANGNNTSSAKMVIGGDGRVGIGTTNPQSTLHLFRNADNQDIKILLTDNTTGATGTDGLTLIKGSDQNGYLWHYDNYNLLFGTNNNERMRIRNDGNVGIGTNNPGNILQIGDGARLRISNGSNDYTILGSKDVDDSANTSIEIYGNTHPSFPGKIYYFATTATGDHTFYTNGSTTLANTLANFSPTKNTFYKNVRAVNYENEGVLYPHSVLINSGGTSLLGYFIPVSDYTNSLMTCAFSHNSTSYTYWRGHVSIGNNNQILGVSSPILGSNLLVESFIQQTTLLQFIRVIPTVSYSSSVQLRVKIYG